MLHCEGEFGVAGYAPVGKTIRSMHRSSRNVVLTEPQGKFWSIWTVTVKFPWIGPLQGVGALGAAVWRFGMWSSTTDIHACSEFSKWEK